MGVLRLTYFMREACSMGEFLYKVPVQFIGMHC